MRMICKKGRTCALFLFAFVLFSGGHAAPDMPLLFVLVQNHSDFFIKDPVILWQPLLKILMYRGF